MTDRPTFNPQAVDAAPINKPVVDLNEAPMAFDPKATLAKIEADAEAKRIEVVELSERPLGPVKAWSFSRLMEFEKCPYATKLKVVDKWPDPSGPAADRGSRIHTSCEDYIQGKTDKLDKEIKHYIELIDRVKQQYAEGRVEIEEDWAFNRAWEATGWRDKDCWSRIKLDVIVHEDETSAHVIDWKTGRKFGNEIKHGQQLQLYAIAAFLRYPKLQFVKAQMVYLDKNDQMTHEYTRQQAMLFMERWDRRGNVMTTTTNFPAKPSKFACKWCAMAKKQDGQDKPACDFRDESV